MQEWKWEELALALAGATEALKPSGGAAYERGVLGPLWEGPELLYIKSTRKEQTLRFALVFKGKV